VLPSMHTAEAPKLYPEDKHLVRHDRAVDPHPPLPPTSLNLGETMPAGRRAAARTEYQQSAGQDLSKFRILGSGQCEPYRSPAHFDPVLDGLSAFKVHQTPAALGKLKKLGGVSESQFARQRRFQVFLKELALPPVTKHEVHEDSAQWSALGAASSAISLAW